LGRIVVASPLVPTPLRDGLSIESGLNDGGSVPFLTLFIALALSEEHIKGEWLTFAVEQIGYGALIGGGVGAAGGLALRGAAERDWTAPEFERLAFAALGVIAWLAADEAGGNGFIAAFVGGGAAGTAAGALRHRMAQFAEEEGQLLSLAVFFIFGLFAAEALDDATATMVVYAVLSLTVVRMVSVAIATIGLGMRPAAAALVGWFGPRGLASIVLALAVVDQAPALAGLAEIFLVMTVTVLLSVLLHGLTAAPLVRRFAAQPARDDRRQTVPL
jgi:NhaP-type Na+/H+ or K+/H+ antiporter